MKFYKILALSLLSLVFLQVNAQTPQATAKPRAAVKAKKKRAPKKTSYSRYNISLVLSQERIEAKKNGETSEIETQMEGLQIGYNKNFPFKRSRWRHSYAGELSLGRLKGKGRTLTTADELKEQPWLGLNFVPAIMMKGTPASEFGIGVPITYRLIQWKLKGGGLDMDRDQSFSAGVSGIFSNQLTANSLLKVSLTYHHMWESTLWSIGWERRL